MKDWEKDVYGEAGQFLPISVYEAQGYTGEFVRANALDHQKMSQRLLSLRSY